MESPAHAAPELVELGEAEALGAFDHDRARVRHVHADLDYDGRDQHLDLPRPELRHHLALVLGLHPAVQQPDSPLRKDILGKLYFQFLRGPNVFEGFGLLDQRADDVRLTPIIKLSPHLLISSEALSGIDDRRLDRLSSRRQLVYERDLQVAEEREGERPRYRGGCHDEGVRHRTLLAEDRPLADPETVLLVHNDER